MSVAGRGGVVVSARRDVGSGLPKDNDHSCRAVACRTFDLTPLQALIVRLLQVRSVSLDRAVRDELDAVQWSLLTASRRSRLG